MSRSPSSPIALFLERQGTVLLDGGLSTQLEAQGHDLSHPLWSARVLLDDPVEMVRSHLAFLEAGADCITSGSYQLSVPGAEALGFSRARALELIEQSVQVACEARDEFSIGLREAGDSSSRLRPLVAASVGPYGAFLADGSEYSGDYGIPRSQLRDFHESRWDALVRAGAELLACETLPSFLETEVLVELLQERSYPAWISFSCRDGERLADGTPVEEAVTLAAASPAVVAVGVNCTRPEYVASLIERVAQAAPAHAIVAYPNAGFRYDGDARSWVGEGSAGDAAAFAAQARSWREQGAALIGGCCGTGPAHIEQLREALLAR